MKYKKSYFLLILIFISSLGAGHIVSTHIHVGDFEEWEEGDFEGVNHEEITNSIELGNSLESFESESVGSWSRILGSSKIILSSDSIGNKFSGIQNDDSDGSIAGSENEFPDAFNSTTFISFYLKTSDSSQDLSPVISFGDGDMSSPSNRGPYFGIRSGEVQYRNGGGWQSSGYSILDNKWYKFGINISVDTNTYDIYVNNSLVFDDAEFRNQKTILDRIAIFADGNGNLKTNIDSISESTKEGYYISERFDYGEIVRLEKINISSSLNNQSIKYSVYADNGNITEIMSSDNEIRNLFDLKSTRYVKVAFNLSTSNIIESPIVYEYQVDAVKEDTLFLAIILSIISTAIIYLYLGINIENNPSIRTMLILSGILFFVFSFFVGANITSIVEYVSVSEYYSDISLVSFFIFFFILLYVGIVVYMNKAFRSAVLGEEYEGDI